jgi:5-methylcytosine-specific restriction endonuclease McrA
MVTRAGDPRGKQIYKRRRLQVLVRDNYTCFYCGGEANQVDHVVPIAKDNSLANAIDMDGLVACCVDCNKRKSSRSIKAFLAITATPPDCASLISPSKTVGTTHVGPMTRTN